MTKVFDAFGGRKMVLLLVGMILLATKQLTGIDDETVNKILYLALGGSGAIALEDGLRGLGQDKSESAPPPAPPVATPPPSTV